jgi:hypothetical protein
MKSITKTITDERSVLVAADDQNRTVYLNIVGNEPVAIGGADVTFANGLLIVKHSSPQQVFVPLKETIFAVCDTGETDDVRVLLPDTD